LIDDNSFIVHRMVQKATKQGSQDSVVTILNLILSSDFINSNVKSHQDLNQMLSVWQQATNSEASSLITSHASRTSQLSYKLIEFSRLGEALQFTKSQLDLLSKILPINHVECLNIEHCVALATEKTGDPLGALQKYESVLKKKQLYLEADDDSTLETGYEMSFVLWQLKQFDRALSLGDKVHQARIVKLGDDNIKTMRSRNNVALVLRDKGRLEEALTLFQQVVRWNEKNLVMKHRTTLITLHNIATCYFFQKNYEEAFSR
jgi:tetratricopeptide (TPR) repeat protein